MNESVDKPAETSGKTSRSALLIVFLVVFIDLLGFGIVLPLLPLLAKEHIASALVPGWSVVALMGLMGFGVGFIGPSRDMLVRRAATSTFGTGAFGRVYGFVYSGIDAGLALAPLAFGPLMDAGRYTHVLWGVALLQTLAIATALAVGSRSRK